MIRKVLSLVMLILMFMVGIVFNAHSQEGPRRYGILGQIAPEFKSIDWVNKEGKNIEPIQLSDYKGKVVYILFFQDW